MVDKEKVESQLAENTGSILDFILGNLDLEDVQKVLEWYADTFQFTEAIDCKGVNHREAFCKKDFSLLSDGFDWSIGCNHLASDNPVYFSGFLLEREGLYRIEFYFNPKDYAFDTFIDFIKQPVAFTKNREYYVMDENASWEYGDDTDEGIIISHKTYPI